MNKYKKLITNTAVLALGTLGSKLLVFLLLPLYTSLLSSSEYSVADIVSQTANLLIPLVSLGMYEAVFRFAMDKDERAESVLATGMYVTLAGSLLFALLLPFLWDLEYFDGYFPLVFLYVVCASIHYLVSRYTRAIGYNTLFAVQGIMSTAVNIALNIIFLIGFDMGVTGYVLSVILSDLSVSLFLFIKLSLFRELSPKNFSRRLLREMLRYSVPLIPTSVFWWVTNVADRYVIRAVLGDSVNGLYAVAFKIPTILLLLSSVFTEAWQFSAVVEKDGSEKKEHAEFFGVVFNSFQGMLFMSAAVLIAASKIFARVLFASSYFEAWRFMPLLIMATVYSSLVTFMGSVYLVDKKSMLSFVTALVGAVTNVVLNLILIGNYGANGAAFATLVCYVVVYIIRAVTSKRLLPFDLHSFKVAANTLILGAESYLLITENSLATVISCVAIVAVFALNARPIIGGVGKVISRRLHK